jgi:hypothetical protein
MSTFADKYVDFEITVEGASGTSSALLPQKSGAPTEQHDMIEDLVFKVSGQLSTVNRMQKYFRTRENRNFSTVRSTEKRIFQFSAIEVCMMVGMAVLQVLVVRFFFQGARKGEFLSLVSVFDLKISFSTNGCERAWLSCLPNGEGWLVFSDMGLTSQGTLSPRESGIWHVLTCFIRLRMKVVNASQSTKAPKLYIASGRLDAKLAFERCTPLLSVHHAWSTREVTFGRRRSRPRSPISDLFFGAYHVRWPLCASLLRDR